jgi:hypothetical protein
MKKKTKRKRKSFNKIIKRKRKSVKKGGSNIGDYGSSGRVPISNSQWNCDGNCFDFLNYTKDYTNYRLPIYSDQWLCNGKCFDYASPNT